ncbi:MAG: hypothetical protein WKH47_03625 [Actinomycetes bacterium]
MPDLDRVLADAASSGRDAARPVAAAQIRRVGAHMRRIRAATAGILSAAAVAGVVGLVMTTTSTDALPDFADTTAPTESASPTVPPSPSESSTPPTTTTPAEPIFTGRMLSAQIIEELNAGSVFQSAWVADDGASDALCVPTVGGAPVETQHVRFVMERSATTALDQWGETFASPAEAAARLAEVRAFFGDCAEQMGDHVDLFWAFTLDGVGDAGFLAVMQQPFSADEQSYVVARAAHTGRVVTWIVSTTLGQDFNSRPAVESLAPAVDLVCGSAGGACAGDPVLTQTYPDADDDVVAGLLTVEDVNASLDGRWRANAGLEPETNAPNFVCSAATLVDAGGTDLATRGFFDEDDPSEPQVTGVGETRATFGSTDAATGYVAAEINAWDSCAGGGVEPVRIGTSAPAWRIDFGDHQQY